jgi:hypothetical protein
MTRKKRRNNQASKQEIRHHRNVFLKKMQHIMALVGDASAFNLLNKNDRGQLFYCRIRPYKIIAPHTKEHAVSRKILKAMNHNLTMLLQEKTVTFGRENIQLSIYDFSVYVESLHLFWSNVPKNSPEIAKQFQACFPVFEEDNFEETRVGVLEEVRNAINLAVWFFSDITRYIMHASPEKLKKPTSPFDTAVYFNNYILAEKQAETEVLKIDGHNRIVYRLYRDNGESFVPLTITPAKLGIDGVMQKFPLQVFIQQHAFIRIGERLGIFYAVYNYLPVVYAVFTQDPVPAENKYSCLFPVTLGRIKVGYLKGDILGDKLVIRTFLFLTNNGTPEGKKLQELIGLQKADKKYLGIDKMSAFIYSDIKEDKKLRNLFREADCGDLFRLNKNLLNDANENKVTSAKLLTQYLGL